MALEELSFESVNGRTDRRTDGRKVITIAHPEHSSGELKKKRKNSKNKTKDAIVYEGVTCIIHSPSFHFFFFIHGSRKRKRKNQFLI